MKQVLVIVNRGITDQTPALVWPWEIPVLEAVHGEGNVYPCEHKETTKWLERNKVHIMNVRPRSEDDDRRNVTDPFNPANDVGGEFERLAAKYGQHLELKMSNVEYVYGRLASGQFERAVLAHTQPTQEVVTTELPEAMRRQLTGAEIRKRLDELKVAFQPSSTVAALRVLLREKEMELAGGRDGPGDEGDGEGDGEPDDVAA